MASKEKMEMEETSPQGEDTGTEYQAKIPEAFQKEACAMVDSCSSVECLDFLVSEVNRRRTELMEESSEAFEGEETPEEEAKEEFSTEGMPDDET